MKRLQLFELQDQPWWPAPLRRAMMEYLAYVALRSDLFAPQLERLATALKRSGSTHILDLCSGAGGPWPSLAPRLATIMPLQRVTLSDRYPDPTYPLQLKNRVLLDYCPEPVDARRVPRSKQGFRTLWNAFHHLTPGEACSVLSDTVAHHEGIAIFEAVERSPLILLQMVLLVPFLVLLDTLRLRPLRPGRLLFTYLLPLLPLAIAFDGVVSCLRSYTPAELEDLTRRADPEGQYHWEIGIDRNHRMAAVTYLIGTPQP